MQTPGVHKTYFGSCIQESTVVSVQGNISIYGKQPNGSKDKDKQNTYILRSLTLDDYCVYINVLY